MYFLIVALSISVVALVVYALLRPFSKRVTFKGVYEVIAAGVIFAPMIAMSLLLTGGIVLICGGLLYFAYGALPSWLLVVLAVVASWSFLFWFLTRKHAQ
jgi:hypothetical protein